jgi:hypothetical protein
MTTKNKSMKTKIMKCEWNWYFNSRADKWETTAHTTEVWLNIDRIITITPIVDETKNCVIGSSIFYALGCRDIKDNRLPDEIREIINNIQ